MIITMHYYTDIDNLYRLTKLSVCYDVLLDEPSQETWRVAQCLRSNQGRIDSLRGEEGMQLA